MQGEFAEALSGFFNKKAQGTFGNLNLEKFPLAALQFSFDRNFAHLCAKYFAIQAHNVANVIFPV